MWLAVILVGAQTFVVTQLGVRLATRISELRRERAERLAGVAQIGVAVLPGAENVA
jgi:putative Mn2+ efflux pump MntP